MLWNRWNVKYFHQKVNNFLANEFEYGYLYISFKLNGITQQALLMKQCKAWYSRTCLEQARYIVQFLFQLRISAYDSRDPSKFTLTDVTINVGRNLNPPVFGRNPYSTRITELYPMGIPVLNITATDPDDNNVKKNYILIFFFLMP